MQMFVQNYDMSSTCKHLNFGNKLQYQVPFLIFVKSGRFDIIKQSQIKLTKLNQSQQTNEEAFRQKILIMSLCQESSYGQFEVLHGGKFMLQCKSSRGVIYTMSKTRLNNLFRNQIYQIQNKFILHSKRIQQIIRIRLNLFQKMYLNHSYPHKSFVNTHFNPSKPSLLSPQIQKQSIKKLYSAKNSISNQGRHKKSGFGEIKPKFFDYFNFFVNPYDQSLPDLPIQVPKYLKMKRRQRKVEQQKVMNVSLERLLSSVKRVKKKSSKLNFKQYNLGVRNKLFQSSNLKKEQGLINLNKN